MTEVTQDARALLAKMDAEQKAAEEAAEKIRVENEARRKQLLEQLRSDDLKTVRAMCEMHGFTATDLRGALKTKGGGSKKTAPRKSATRSTTGTRRKKSST